MPPEQSTTKFDSLLTLAGRVPGLDDAAIISCLDVLRTADAMRSSLEERFFKGAVSEGRFTVLALLLTASDWSMTPSEIARASGVTRATMTGLLDGLEGMGFVERKPFRNDRRKLTIRLTATGRTFLLELLPAYFEQLSTMGGHISQSRQRSLSAQLESLREGAD